MMQGSSPLARGLRQVLVGAGHLRRIIPARAGFTPPHMGRDAPTEDHPRSRGVYTHSVPPIPTHVGSSPLARGLPVCDPGAGDQGRIIPARAGFTVVGCSAHSGLPDHPRSRGVYICADGRGKKATGSSPLARGLRAWRRRRVGTGRDHPRSRGVYHPDSTYALADLGSSPLARGLHTQVRLVAPGGGIIPARAGFTRRYCDQ